MVGTRAAQQAFLFALLEPTEKIMDYEEKGKNFERLAYLEGMKTLLFGAVYDKYCLDNNVPAGIDYVAEIQKYESDVLSKR